MFFNRFFGFDDMGDSFPDMNFGERQLPVDNDLLYNILGVPKTATDGEIKRAYHVLAKKYHPDRGGDAAKFQEIQAAYDVLSNTELRRRYDLTGEVNLDIEEESVPKTKDVKKKIVCPLEDLYKGKNFNMKITRKVVCRNCNGEGGSAGYRTPCRRCNGKGTYQIEVRDFVFSRFMSVECEYCKGRGAVFNTRLQCPICHGNRVVPDEKQVSFFLEPGMGTGSVIRIPEAADEAPGHLAGDVLLVIEERPHPIFNRKGSDLLVHINISLGEAICGFVKPFQHLDGKVLHIRGSPCQVKTGSVMMIPNEGMPIEGDMMHHGSLFIEFTVDYPQQLDPQQLEIFRSLLNVPAPIVNEQMDVHDLVPQTVQFGNSVPQSNRRREAYDEDASREDSSIPSINCPVQ